ncbi:hypothetical protein BFX40_13580 [Mesorhizobium sp. SEMIA 3007]|nr:hypothetical protein BFX40_13580 [Mesorhizobium sp. SEMIA 3007]
MRRRRSCRDNSWAYRNPRDAGLNDNVNKISVDLSDRWVRRVRVASTFDTTVGELGVIGEHSILDLRLHPL